MKMNSNLIDNFIVCNTFFFFAGRVGEHGVPEERERIIYSADEPISLVLELSPEYVYLLAHQRSNSFNGIPLHTNGQTFLVDVSYSANNSLNFAQNTVVVSHRIYLALQFLLSTDARALTCESGDVCLKNKIR